MSPRVTVLMTVYNGLPFLPEAIESVLRQTFADFELLLIDDASTDASLACIRSYPDARIRLVCNEQNRGQAHALNQGLWLARGAYIARLDQDDVCLPNRLQRQVVFLEQRPEVAAVGTWQYWIGPEGRKRGLEPGVVGLRTGDFGTFLGTLLTYATPVAHPTVMYRREAVSAVNGYDETFAPCEDYELWCRLALRRHQLAVLPQPLVMVRIHERQQSVAKLALQQANARRAHERLVAACCGGQEARGISRLLQLEPSFWDEHPSMRQVQAVIRSLGELLDTVRETFRLSRREYANLTCRISWWLGRGACLAVVRRQRQSLPVYLFAWRAGVRMLRCPTLLAYPWAFLLSPCFVSPVRRLLASVAVAVKRQRAVARLMLDYVSRRERDLLTAAGWPAEGTSQVPLHTQGPAT